MEKQGLPQWVLTLAQWRHSGFFTALKWPYRLCAGMLVAVPAIAAVPLNDRELNNNYLTSRVSPAQVDVAQFNRVLKFDNPQALPVTFVPVNGLSSLTFLLNEHDRKDVMTVSNPYMNAWSFGQNATKNFDSEDYSFRWEGNYPDIYDLSKMTDYSFSNSTGTYELNNIRGKVEFDVTLRDDDAGVIRFRQLTRVFN